MTTLKVGFDFCNSPKKAIDIAGGNSIAYQNLGVLYARTGQLDQAVETLLKGESISSDFLPTLLTLGKVYKDLDKCGEALKRFDKAISLDPGLEDVRMLATDCAIQLGDKSRADSYLVELLKINPANAEAARLLDSLRTH